MIRFSSLETMEYAGHVRGVIITGGAAPPAAVVATWLADAALVVAADSGLHTAVGYGIRPELVVGDFDSIVDDALLNGYADRQIRRFPRAKDHTDTEIALRVAREEGCDDLVLIGGGGGRADHFLALVTLFERPDPPRAWVSDTAVVSAIVDSTTEYGSIGERISFAPLGCVPCRMTTRGLRWPLDGLTWGRGDIGISNEFAEREIHVAMRSGQLLMVRTLEAQ